MPPKKRIKLKAGDVFRFKAGEVGSGYGHIIISEINQYIVIFEPIFTAETSLDKVLASEVMLAGATTDAQFYHGFWEVVGNCSNERELEYPHYKVGIGGSGEMWVVDFFGDRIRKASQNDLDNLGYRSSSSSKSYEAAFLAHHRLIEHKPYYDELYYIGYCRNRQSEN